MEEDVVFFVHGHFDFFEVWLGFLDLWGGGHGKDLGCAAAFATWAEVFEVIPVEESDGEVEGGVDDVLVEGLEELVICDFGDGA